MTVTKQIDGSAREFVKHQCREDVTIEEHDLGIGKRWKVMMGILRKATNVWTSLPVRKKSISVIGR